MREIKFRGRRIDTGEWVCGHYYSFVVAKKLIVGITDENGTAYMISPETVGQYTELHDDEEDQNELYESDIVEIEYEGEKYVCLIEFSAGTFLFTNDALPDGYIPVHEFVDYDRHYGWVNGCRKLGNRWGHPNLLGGNQG